MKPISDGRKAALQIKIGAGSPPPEDDGGGDGSQSPDDGTDLTNVVQDLQQAIAIADDPEDKAKLSQALQLVMEVAQEESSEGDEGGGGSPSPAAAAGPPPKGDGAM